MSEMTFDRIYGLALVALGLFIWYLAHLFHRADDEVEASVTRALGPVVPFDKLMDGPEEQVGDDTLALFGTDVPDMDVEAGITYNSEQFRLTDSPEDVNGDGSLVYGPAVVAERERMRDNLLRHTAAYAASDIDAEWERLATLPAREWPRKDGAR